jgi:hypothetical protein
MQDDSLDFMHFAFGMLHFVGLHYFGNANTMYWPGPGGG